LQRSPVLQHQISASNPASAPAGVGVILAFRCVLVWTCNSCQKPQHPGGCCPAGRGELVPCAQTAVPAGALCTSRQDCPACSSHSLQLGSMDISGRLNSHMGIAMNILEHNPHFLDLPVFALSEGNYTEFSP